MNPYADTNFFTRLYLDLPESPAADRLLLDASCGESAPLPLTWLLQLEILNAFQLHVFQAHESRQPSVTSRQAALAHANFLDDAKTSKVFRRATVPTIELERQFEELSLRHTARHGFRTYDLLHVASALLLDCDTFWTFDKKANKLAKLEGLKTR